MLYWTQTSPSASVIVQPNQTVTVITTHSTVQIKHLTSSFTYFPAFIQKLKKEAKWSAIKVATLPAYHNYTQENCEESQQNNRLGTVSNNLLDGGLNNFTGFQPSPIASAGVRNV